MTDSELLRAVREAAADEFDVLGEIARDEGRTFVFLARDLKSTDLVALKVVRSDPDESGHDQYLVEIVRELDASIPDIEIRCPRCGRNLRRWARFCTQCGADVSGIGPSARDNLSRDTLRNAVRVVAQSEYEVLGEMPRAEGGGLVYFARDRKNGSIVALRLQRESDSEYALDVTRVLKSVGPPPRSDVAQPRASGPATGSTGSGPSLEAPAGSWQRERPPGDPLPTEASGDPSGGRPHRRILADVPPRVVASVLVALALLAILALIVMLR